jgi:hypothetical protein
LAILESELAGILLVEGCRRGDKSSLDHFRCFIAFRKAVHAQGLGSAAGRGKIPARQAGHELVI